MSDQPPAEGEAPKENPPDQQPPADDSPAKEQQEAVAEQQPGPDMEMDGGDPGVQQMMD